MTKKPYVQVRPGQWFTSCRPSLTLDADTLMKLDTGVAICLTGGLAGTHHRFRDCEQVNVIGTINRYALSRAIDGNELVETPREEQTINA